VLQQVSGMGVLGGLCIKVIDARKTGIPDIRKKHMGGMSLMHWLIVAAVGLLVFGGRGKLSAIMKDAAEGIKGFRAGMADDKTEAAKAAEKVNDAMTSSKSKTEA
jgi:sec-independent protein translocase protein TatA